MMESHWRRLKERYAGSLAGRLIRFVDRWVDALRIPAPEARQWIRRITFMERDVILPIKVAAVAMLFYSFYSKEWINRVSGTLEVEVEFTRSLFWFYVAGNAAVAGLLLGMRRLPLPLVQWGVFAGSLMDGIFFSMLVVVMGGYNSPLYYLFLAMIVRSSVSIPRATSQILLNLTLSGCFMFAGFVDLFVRERLSAEPDALANLGLSEDYPAESVWLRLLLLLLLTVCCYGVQVLFERQRRVQDEAREFAVREGQLRSAGRMAAEFAHQIKNPLAIINTATYSLQRSLRNIQDPDITEQIQMIQEEVERSDIIITQIMGYAQLSEGRVEKLDLPEELDLAIGRVFPPAARYPIEVHRGYGREFPPLLMQRRHLSETLINLLQNAREALEEKGGRVTVAARCAEDSSIEITVGDNGPGIPPDRQERVFQAYYTTKKKGTGLGLASVKHNVELYGGTVRLESELGKGARFILLFPSRTLEAPAQMTT